MPSNIPNDRIVFILRRDSQCGRCGLELGKGRFICLAGGESLCLGCAGLAHLEFLPRGDSAVTRRATKYSSLHVVVMRKSATRKRAERQGILVEPEAIRRAEQESSADADQRSQRQQQAAKHREKAEKKYVAAFAEAIREQYPCCPEEDCQKIAAHACQKYSGRVGRSAAAKQFEPTAVRLATTAHIRHRHTNYDTFLRLHGDKELAREDVRWQVQEILDAWEHST